MAGKGGDYSGDITLGSDTWNVADGFTKLKILRQLVMLDQWETISQFGGEEFDGDLNMNDNQIKKRRVEGLQRFHATLRQLIGNVMFALKSEDKKKIKMMGERIDNVKEFLGEVYEMREDDITHEEVAVIPIHINHLNNIFLFGVIKISIESYIDHLICNP